MLDFFQLEDASLLTWSHAVNTKQKLISTISSKYDFIEADVSYYEDKHDEPIMAHPPDETSDLTFKAFIDLSKLSRKGLKLDFKTQNAIGPCLDYLKKCDINNPVILNADILQGDNSPQVKIDPHYFINTCTNIYPNGIISIGWTTNSIGKYDWDNINQAIDLCKIYNLNGDKIHFAIRNSWCVKSIEKLVYLHKITACSFTVWSHDYDVLSSYDTLFLMMHFFNKNVIFYDLTKNEMNYFNENKYNYENILKNSNDKNVRKYLTQ